MGRSGVDGPAAVREALDCRWYWSSPTSPKLKKVFADTFGTKGQVAFEGGAEQRQVPQTGADDPARQTSVFHECRNKHKA